MATRFQENPAEPFNNLQLQLQSDSSSRSINQNVNNINNLSDSLIYQKIYDSDNYTKLAELDANLKLLGIDSRIINQTDITLNLGLEIDNPQEGDTVIYDAVQQKWRTVPFAETIGTNIKHANIRNLNNTQVNIFGRTQLKVDGLLTQGSFNNLGYQFWDIANNKIVADKLGSVYLLRVTIVVWSGTVGGSIGIDLDMGLSTPINIYSDHRILDMVPETIVFTVPFYVGQTFLNNGCRIFINNQDPITLSNVSLYVIQLV